MKSKIHVFVIQVWQAAFSTLHWLGSSWNPVSWFLGVLPVPASAVTAAHQPQFKRPFNSNGMNPSLRSLPLESFVSDTLLYSFIRYSAHTSVPTKLIWDGSSCLSGTFWSSVISLLHTHAALKSYWMRFPDKPVWLLIPRSNCLFVCLFVGLFCIFSGMV